MELQCSADVHVFYTIPIDASDGRGPAFLHLIGRLRAGSSLQGAQADAGSISAQINPFDGGLAISKFRLYVFSLQADVVRDVRSTLLLLFGGVILVLLIGCANVCNLLVSVPGGARVRQRFAHHLALREAGLYASC